MANETKAKKETDYKTLFIIGIVFMGTGTVFLTTLKNPVGAAIMGVGAIMMLTGAKNKDKWKK